MYAMAVALCVMILSGSTVFGQTPPVDPEKLPVSLDRIRMKLSAPSDKKVTLNIERIIEVVGVAPPIELWSAEEQIRLVSGPSLFGPPTQKDILDITTPQEFKRYPIDLVALFKWLARKDDERKAE
jgi:hypothetical protein